MNGFLQTTIIDDRPDLLPHKYRPESIDKFRCHLEQAQRLKQWILDFISSSNSQKTTNEYDSEDFYSDSESSEIGEDVTSRCVLLTGPSGVGKTSLVYTVAKELNLHVIESNISEKRDFKLFSRLKLTNQKGKINPIAKLFQVASDAQKSIQSKNRNNSKRKRRKLGETTNVEDNKPPQNLSLSGDIPILLFDDIDVTFDGDGPFFKPLVDFIHESKRPVILTATNSIERLKSTLDSFEHIHLDRPLIDDCVQLLKSICKREKYHKASRLDNCHTLASNLNCDIRGCLNRLHFYGDLVGEVGNDLSNETLDISNLRPSVLDHEDENKSLLVIYTTYSILDLISTTITIEHDYYDQVLGEQIENTIIELSNKLYNDGGKPAFTTNLLEESTNPVDDKGGDEIKPVVKETDDKGHEEEEVEEIDWSFTDTNPGKQTGLMFLRRSNRNLRQRSLFDSL